VNDSLRARISDGRMTVSGRYVELSITAIVHSERLCAVARRRLCKQATAAIPAAHSFRRRIGWTFDAGAALSASAPPTRTLCGRCRDTFKPIFPGVGRSGPYVRSDSPY